MVFEIDYADNIAVWNPKINELTSQYLAWKNLLKDASDDEWVRFSHYRRWLLELPDNPDEHDVDLYICNKYRCVSQELWFKNCHPPYVWDVMEMYMMENLRPLECKLFAEWKRMEYFIAPMHLSAMRLGLAKKWWEWIFPKIFDIDPMIPYDEEKYKTLYQRRACGFMAERLFSFWVYLMQHQGIKTQELNFALVDGLKPFTMQQEMQTRI